MPGYAWMLLAVLLLVPAAVVVWLHCGRHRRDPAIDCVGGMLFAFASFAAALWIIHDKLP